MEKLNTSTLPKHAKVHSRTWVEKFLQLGWTIGVEIKADDGETYEWLLNWHHETDPVRPSYGEPASSHF